MDGLLLDTEDRYSECTNRILARYGKPQLPWSIKAKLQGRPGPQAVAIFYSWAQLPITVEEYLQQLTEIQRELFPHSQPLPGVEKLLDVLRGARTVRGEGVNVGLATSSHVGNFKLKTAHLGGLFGVFDQRRRVLGDDERIPKGRGKPAPEIYLLALKMINESLKEGEREVVPEECLVFEDSVPGVEAGRRAGMRVVWVPHPALYVEYQDRVKEVLAGRTGEAGQVDLHQLGEVDDGWGEYLKSLENFDYGKYGIVG
jgi:pseudouridine 5'-phosphatase